ncbi:MAG: DUF5591 domain-containing protein [Candidatus Helarchaeota archaeon]
MKLESLRLLNNKSVIELFEKILKKYSSCKLKDSLVILQCSKLKPYSKSYSHKFYRRAIKLGTGYDPIDDYERCPISVVVLSSLIGPVPYEFENEKIVRNYQLSVNKLPNRIYREVKDILVNRFVKFLEKYGKKFKYIIALVKNKYYDVMKSVNDIYTEKEIEILPKNRSLHIIREAWCELKVRLGEIYL